MCIFNSSKKVEGKKKKGMHPGAVNSTSLFCPQGGGVQVAGVPGGLVPHWCHQSPSPVSEPPKAPNAGILLPISLENARRAGVNSQGKSHHYNLGPRSRAGGGVGVCFRLALLDNQPQAVRQGFSPEAAGRLGVGGPSAGVQSAWVHGLCPAPSQHLLLLEREKGFRLGGGCLH